MTMLTTTKSGHHNKTRNVTPLSKISFQFLKQKSKIKIDIYNKNIETDRLRSKEGRVGRCFGTLLGKRRVK